MAVFLPFGALSFCLAGHVFAWRCPGYDAARESSCFEPAEHWKGGPHGRGWRSVREDFVRPSGDDLSCGGNDLERRVENRSATYSQEWRGRSSQKLRRAC